ISMWQLPIEQYPEITPPTVQVTAQYPGANAQVVANTVAAPIEQQVNGVPNMLYMSSTSSDGSYSLTVTFEIGTDLDVAQVQVQNRLAAAEPTLPEEVRRQGVTAKKQTPNIILALALQSEGDKYDGLFLGNYATLNLKDELSRVRGVGDARVFGSADYSMRVWIDPAKLKARGMGASDVLEAIREQNVQVAAGQVNQPPSIEADGDDALAFQYTVTTLGRLSDVSQFENIVVKTAEGSRVTRLKDVARVELGGMTYDTYNLREGRPTAAIGIFQSPGSNALDVAEEVKAVMERLSKSFPEGLYYAVALDTTKFVEASIHEVYMTLLEAGVLVLIVIMVFLQDWRALLIPATTVPVTIIGAFFAMAMMDYTVNMLTLFGLVLAIGIVVDDAIVVVENAAHHIEQGLPPKQATIKAMDEVLGPIIGITLVLMSVFLPSAFMPGITGMLYQQFALTIAATALISAINAMTLKPAQCALWMRRPSGRKNVFYRTFNAAYERVAAVYMAITRFLVRHVAMTMLAFAALVGGTAFWYQQVPTGFLPIEDQGYALVSVSLPDAASQPRTRQALKRVDEVLQNTPGVGSWFTIGGTSFIENSNASNFATLFVTFEAWDARLDQGLTLDAMMGQLFGGLGQIQEANILAFPPPPIRGLGVRGGFDMQVQDRGAGRDALGQGLEELVSAANGQTQLQRVYSSFRPGVPQVFVDIDREKVKLLDVPLGAVFSTLQASMGAAYVNDFNKFGRVYQVRVQAEQKYRARPDDIKRLEVRSRAGNMVPLGTIAEVRESFGPQVINRYNLYPSASVSGGPAPGVSTGQALNLMEQAAAKALPQGVGYEWSGISFQEKRVGGEAVLVFGMAVVLVYLVLAAQYESWFTPFAVILVVPLGLLGAIGATSLRGMDNNLFTQIGIVLIIALASKNAILIVEFATDIRRRGVPVREAALEAARLRFRPILMTSFAFILGVLPLVFAEGAGAAGQQALGTAVFGGMLASTILAVFFVPVFYVVFQGLAELWGGRKGEQVAEPQPAQLPLFAERELEPALAE
ncbi:MAG TPA: multidrug efflux RND transporter permease subunit, partial [Lacipirellulaceae bacterium]|nr:multidrug efflux RND transporter permease subunit [Lacipirellulaceae bacterium]